MDGTLKYSDIKDLDKAFEKAPKFSKEYIENLKMFSNAVDKHVKKEVESSLQKKVKKFTYCKIVKK